MSKCNPPFNNANIKAPRMQFAIDSQLDKVKLDEEITNVSAAERSFAANKIDELKALDRKEENGSTLNWDNSEYSKGGVAVTFISQNFKDINDVSTSKLEGFKNINKAHKTNDNVKVGVYKFPNDTKASLDLNLIIPQEYASAGLLTALALGQESTYNLDTYYNAKTGRSGDNTIRPTAKQSREIQEYLLRGELSPFIIKLLNNRKDVPHINKDGKFELVHWSNVEGLDIIDPINYGGGIKGAEMLRKKTYPGYWVNRSYYGMSFGKPGGYKKESTLGPHKYSITISPTRLYNMKSEPDNIRSKAKKKLEEIGDNSPKAQKTIYEYMIREAGYDGYWVADQSLGLSAAVFVPLTPSR